MKKITTIKLHGWLGKKYGKTFKLYVTNVKEAVKLLSAQLKGFRADILKNNSSFRVIVNNEEKSENEILDYCSGQCIRIIPVISGSGNAGKIIVGAALIYMSGGVGGVAGDFMTNFGWGLVFSGAVGLVFGTPKPSTSEDKTESKKSYLFSGTINTVGQSNQVPIILGGPIRIGSQTISSGISTVSI